MNDQEYILAERLDRLFDWTADADFVEDTYDAVRPDLTTPYPPDVADLVRLHRSVRRRRAFTVLEFGVGYSTFVIADALHKNMKDWERLDNPPEIRNRNLWRCCSLDASTSWLANVESRMPEWLAGHVRFAHSEVHVGTYYGQLCHYYDTLPNVVPDFIYLDGPHPKDVKGNWHGLSFQCDERTVMAADLLLMESTLLPGCTILVDGRTNNARFLQRNFKREWKVMEDAAGDVTHLHLVEDRLGRFNILGTDPFND